MKQRVIRMTAAIILILLVIPLTASAMDAERAEELTPIESYTYPITSDSPDWFNYSVLAKSEMLRIPEETLARMTDEAVIQAVADYPYLIDLYVYGTFEDGLRTCRSYFSALDELMNRQSARDALATYGLQIAEAAAERASLDSEDSHSGFVMDTMQDLINYLCDDFSVDIHYDEAAGTYTVVPVTPNGSKVSYSTPSETHGSTST